MEVKEIKYCEYNTKDLITCVLITYKQSTFLYDCIDSILQQDKVKVQLIVADDGTPDYSFEEIERYIENNRSESLVSAIYIHHKKNVGTVRNINSAIKLATGEYLKIIGGDDAYPDKDVFFCQKECLDQSSKILVVVGKLIDTDENLNPIFNPRIDSGNQMLMRIFDMDYVEARKEMNARNLFPIANQASCFRKEFFDKYGLCDERYRVVEDAELALRVLEHKNEAVALDKICVYHRQKGGISTSKKMFEPRRLAYYHDFVIFSEIQSIDHPEVFSFISRIEIPRISKYVYEMAKEKSGNTSMMKMLLISLKYIDAILFYVVSKPKRLLTRIKERFS